MKRTVGLGVAVVVLLASANTAFGAWSPGASGSGYGSARSVGLPTSPQATATGQTAIQVTWNPPGGTSITPTQYRVRRTAPSATTVCTVNGATLACDDTGLTAATTYTYTIEANIGANWTSGQTAGTSATTNNPGPFLLTAPGTKVAGSAFTATLTATTNGVTTDTSYIGVKTITFSGPNPSPSGTNPTYPATVTFTAGIASASITLFAAETPTLSATDGTRSGSTALTVTSGAASQLGYTSSTPTCSSGSVVVGNGGSFTSRVTVYDQYLNPFSQASNRTVTLTRSPSGTGTLTPTSLTIPTGSSQTSTTFTYTLPSGNAPNVTVTAASPSVASTACIVKKN